MTMQVTSLSKAILMTATTMKRWEDVNEGRQLEKMEPPRKRKKAEKDVANADGSGRGYGLKHMPNIC